MEAPSDPNHAPKAARDRRHSNTTVLRDRTRPLPTVKSSVLPPTPPQSRPLLLSSSLIEIQLRKRLQGLSDPADDSCYLPPSQVLKDEFKSAHTEDLRSHHLSWDVLHKLIRHHFRIILDLHTDELGWMQVSKLGAKYIPITDELTFHNAIGVLQNNSSSDTGSLITVHLWSPRPEDPFFRRSRKAPHAPGEASGGISEKQDGEAAAPALDRLNSPPLPPSGSLLTTLPPALRSLSSSEPGALPKDHTPLPPPSPRRTLAAFSKSPSPDASEIEIDINRLLEEQSRKELVAPEQDEDEDDADFQARLAEYQEQLAENVVERLQYELDSEVCEHLDEEIWLKVCAFFHHDPNLKSAEYIVEVKGFGRKLLPVQAHAVYWALHLTDGVHGSVFIGHVMGLGKTTKAFAICLVRHKLNCMHFHINQHPESHYLKGLSASVRCPMNESMLKDYGLDCPCAPDSPTYFTKSAYGFSLVMAPQALMQVWMDEGAACFPNDRNPFQMRIMRAHKADLSKDQLRLLEADRDEKQLDPDGTPLVPCLYPKLVSSRCIVVTTSHSFDSKVKQPLTCKDREVTQQPPWRYETATGSRMRRQKDIVKESVPFFFAFIAQVFRDEFHVEKNEGSKTISVLKIIQLQAQRANDEPPRLICLSGTPLTTGPSDLSNYIKAMVRPQWEAHPVLRRWTGDKVIELGKRWDTLCRTGHVSVEDSQDCITRFRPLVEELMVRFTSRSNFLGTGPVVVVPKNVFREVYAKLDGSWETRLAQQKAEEDERVRLQEQKRRARYSQTHHGNMGNYKPLDKTRPNSYYRVRLYASFPALIDLTDEDGNPLKLTEQEWVERIKEKEWEPETDSDPYFRNRHKIFASSAKLREIRQIWREFAHKIDALKELARLIFCSYFFTGSYILYLFFKYKIGIDESDLVFLNKTMTQSRIDKGISDFNYGRESDSHKPQLLIATTASFGLGQTLNKAIGIGLLEPDYRLFVILQTFGRHTRQGNPNPKTWSWLFRTQNSGVEERITSVNMMRAQIEETIQAKVGEIGTTMP